jgi:hypothetical protein
MREGNRMLLERTPFAGSNSYLCYAPKGCFEMKMQMDIIAGIFKKKTSLVETV